MLLHKKYRTQLYATVVGNFLSLAYGISLGWPSPTLPLLQSENTPFERPLTLDEISWIASVYLIGGMSSTPIFGWMANTFGRKSSLLVSALPQLVSWIIVEFSSSAMHLYFARFMVGFGGTGFYLILPMLVAEISQDEIRGALGSIMMVTTNLGIVIGYTINSYLDYYTVPFIVSSILMVFLVGFYFAADSPKHLMVQDKVEQAVMALKFYRANSAPYEEFSKKYQEEIVALKLHSPANQKKEDSEDGGLSLSDFTSRSALMSILIGVVLMFLEVVNGFTAISNYSETIFRDAGSTLSPALSTVILGIIILGGAYSSTLLIEKAGRKILMTTSAMGCGISLSIVAVYSYLKDHGHDVTPYSWMPLLCLSTFMLLGSIGVFTLHLVIISEVLAQKIRGVVITILVFENWFVSFLTVKYFPILLPIIGMHGCMMIFAATCFGGALFVVLVLPETKGRSIEDIVRELDRR